MQAAQAQVQVTINAIRVRLANNLGTQGTAAVAELTDGSFEIIAQQFSQPIQTVADYFVQQGATVTIITPQQVVSGLHAEALVVQQHSGNWAAVQEVQASQPICERCRQLLLQCGITVGNPGNHYTKQWVAPDCIQNINVNSPYPAVARDDKQKDGQSGKRWIRANGVNKPIAKGGEDGWAAVHPNGW